jgi:hypothetical protein
MPARRYRFHCTTGHELVTHLEGRSRQSALQVRRQADRVALSLMETVEWFDWVRWQVEVYDPKGRPVWLRAFQDVDIDVDLRPA